MQTIKGYTPASLQDHLESEKLTLYAALERYAKGVSVFKKSHRQETARINRWKLSDIAAKSLGSIKRIVYRVL